MPTMSASTRSWAARGLARSASRAERAVRHSDRNPAWRSCQRASQADSAGSALRLRAPGMILLSRSFRVDGVTASALLPQAEEPDQADAGANGGPEGGDSTPAVAGVRQGGERRAHDAAREVTGHVGGGEAVAGLGAELVDLALVGDMHRLTGQGVGRDADHQRDP